MVQTLRIPQWLLDVRNRLLSCPKFLADKQVLEETLRCRVVFADSAQIIRVSTAQLSNNEAHKILLKVGKAFLGCIDCLDIGDLHAIQSRVVFDWTVELRAKHEKNKLDTDGTIFRSRDGPDFERYFMTAIVELKALCPYSNSAAFAEFLEKLSKRTGCKTHVVTNKVLPSSPFVLVTHPSSHDDVSSAVYWIEDNLSTKTKNAAKGEAPGNDFGNVA